MFVKDRDEQKAHDDASQYGADGKLRVAPVLSAVARLRCTEESGRANLSRENGSQHCPPCDLSVTQGESLHAAAFAPLRKADAHDDGEVGDEDNDIEKVGHGV